MFEEETTLNVTNFPINSTSAPRVSENTTLSEEELTLNFTTDPLQDFETTDISDDGNASQEPTENVDHSNKKCASPETLNYLETPCGTKVLPGPRRCDVNNLFRVKLGAQMLLATLVSLFFVLCVVFNKCWEIADTTFNTNQSINKSIKVLDSTSKDDKHFLSCN